jgi:hypothetical protein
MPHIQYIVYTINFKECCHGQDRNRTHYRCKESRCTAAEKSAGGAVAHRGVA